MRIDKFIWCIRIYKTRSLASKECSAEKVKLNGDFAKPSKEVQVGDTVEIKVAPIWKSFKIKDIPKSRVGAKLVPDFVKETTSEAALEELALVQKMNAESRSFGIIGRPTKRDRRDLDKFKGG